VSRIDRYLLSQLLQLFGFFALVLVAVYWINQVVRLFDQLIGDGQSALVFLEFSVLTLPNAVVFVLPVAAFAAALYAVNRLSQESELVVVQATGFSAFRLARPVVYFGLCVMAMQLVLANALVPTSQRMLNDRSAEISQNVTSRFLNAGEFMHPAKGVALYIREITPNGELIDLFLADERGESERVIHTASKAFLVRGEPAPKLVMLNGSTQALSRADGRLSVTLFADFTLDLAGLIAMDGTRGQTVTTLPTRVLLAASAEDQTLYGFDRDAMLEAGHQRLAAPLMALVAPALGYAALLIGGFSRLGLWRQMGLAVVLLIVMQMLSTWATGTALRTTGGWPLLYIAPGFGAVASVVLLFVAQRPRRLRRSAA